MQINVTNGTLTQIQETLSPSIGYDLPHSIAVTGAQSTFNNNLLTLTNLTSTMSITAEGVLKKYSGFNNLSLTEHDSYITLTFNEVDFNLSALKFTNQVISYTDGTVDNVDGNLSIRDNSIYLEVENE